MARIKIYTIVCVIFLAAYIVFSRVEANECYFDNECPSSIYDKKRYCCDRNYPESNICMTNCLRETCISNRNCADGEFCCNRVCRSDCIGESCETDYDCGLGECCDSDDKCAEGHCGLSGWIVAVIIIISTITIFFLCYCCTCRSSTRTAFAGAIVRQPTIAGTRVVGTQQQNQYHPVQQGQQIPLQSFQPKRPPQVYPPPGRAYRNQQQSHHDQSEEGHSRN